MFDAYRRRRPPIMALFSFCSSPLSYFLSPWNPRNRTLFLNLDLEFFHSTRAHSVFFSATTVLRISAALFSHLYHTLSQTSESIPRRK